MATDKAWKTVALGDLISIKHGWPFRGELFSQELTGRPIVVNIGNFEYSGGFRFDRTILKEYRGDYPREYELRPGDILVVMTCQTAGGEILGIPGRIPSDGHVYLHNQRMGKVLVKQPKLIDINFLYWLFLWKDFNLELFASSSGTKIVHTSPSRIEAFSFDLPLPHEQAHIARILDALQMKIDLNRRMNQTLEGLARAFFKSWFVDFDPVVAKAAGKKPVGMSAHTAALFPDSFQDSELGAIPKGWHVGSIADLARYVNGRNFTKNATGTGRMVIRIAELNSGPGGSTVYNDMKADAENTVLPGDVLFAWSGSLDVYRWHGDEALVNQHIFKVLPKEYPQWFVYHHLREAMDFFQGIAADKATTMGHIKREHLSQALLALPSDHDLIRAATRSVGPLYDRIHYNERQNAKLAALRDALLPRLISGELRIGQTTAMAEDALANADPAEAHLQ